MEHIRQPPFLPVSREELTALQISRPDITIVSGDAYVDHPSFAAALLGRYLWNTGFTVAIIPQPDPKDPETIIHLPPPRLFFAISGGSVDSMVSNYTPARKRRSDDAYSPGGKPKRPDRAVLVYSDLVHRLFPDIPLVIGGIEASLRRFAHYDYWSDRIRQSILADAPVDLLVYGMGELALHTLAEKLSNGGKIREIRDIPGTTWKIPPKEYRDLNLPGSIEIPSFKNVSDNNNDFCTAHRIIAENQDPISGKTIIQRHPKTVIVQNHPARPLTTREMDALYGLPFKRREHPSYPMPVPALNPVRFSIISHRGCYGNCHFCAISMHQGKIIQSRSSASVLAEIKEIAGMKEFTGTISDIGGPSANMYDDHCNRWDKQGACTDRECVTCPSLKHNISSYLDLLDKATEIERVRHVFIGSGLRYDLIPMDPVVMKRICDHISGQMKVAPEHIVPSVMKHMNKPDGIVFEQFRQSFEDSQAGKKRRQYLIPYLMSGHPGCTIYDMITLAEYLRDTKMYPEQVQDFTPTPLTISTCMYATGLDPVTGKPVHVPKEHEKRIQRAILHWKDPANHHFVLEGIRAAQRPDLIGTGDKCLIYSEKKEEIRPYFRKNRHS
ncbi:MAG: YgiQ family radical SAM protein [Methanomicrobiales archaeon]|nr:YgiQ family radical SAM protein [Methanomicrobiales archaeon]